MQRKSIFAILGVMLAVVVTSLSLVFAVGPMVSADDENGEPKIGLFDKAEYFNIDEENGILCGLSEAGFNYGSENNFNEIYVVIPNTVTEIRGFWGYPYGYGQPFSAFGYLSQDLHTYFEMSHIITSIVFPDNLKTIGDYAFFESVLENIKVPDTVTKIGNYALYSCQCIETFIIPNNVQEIGYGIFNDDQHLGTIYCECKENEKPSGWDNNWDYYENNYNFPDSNVPIFRSRTLYIWNCNRTVSFNTNGGNETIADQTVCVDHYVVAPTNPTRENYVFQYWYASDENTPFDFANEQVTDNMTLTAKWEPVASQNNENQNNNEVANNETPNNVVSSDEKKFNPVIAWISGGIAAGLGLLGTAAIVVTKRRK